MPDWKPEIERRIAGLKLRAERECEITDELEQHLTDRYQELLAAGANEPEAYRQSIEELSDEILLARELKRVEEQTNYEPIVWGSRKRGNIVKDFVQDLRYGIRALAQTPMFAVIAVVALALGIGANTAVFSVFNGVLLKPLPYPEPERLIWVWPADPKTGEEWHGAISPPDFVDYRKQSTVFDPLAAFLTVDLTMTGSGEPERVPSAAVSAGFFEALGVKPAIGRVVQKDDENAAWPQVAILSDGLWRRRFGGDPAILGKTMTIDGKSITIVGIMPAGFEFPKAAQLWQPMPLGYKEMKVRRFHFLRVIGRLKQGVSIEQAQSELRSICAGLATLYPDSNAQYGAKVVRLLDQVAGDLRPTLVVLMIAVAFVLLIACANVAHLLLARGTSRQREIAIRTSLGASTSRIVRQLLTESVLLAAAGGTLGVLLAFWGLQGLVALHPVNLPRLSEVHLDMRVLAFTAMLSILTGLLFGLVPAFRAARPQLTETLKDSGRGASAGRSNQRFHNILVTAEVAFAVVLLAGAGLMIRSFQKLENVNPGFDPNGVLALRVDLPMEPGKEGESYRLKNDKAIPFFRELIDRLKALPGVESVGLTSELPLSGQNNDTSFTIEGRPPVKPSQRPNADQRQSSPDYFKAMGIPLIKGRYFSDADNENSSKVVIINQALANRYFPKSDPIGQHLVIDFGEPFRAEIVGIVGDVHHRSLSSRPYQEMYVPCMQSTRLRMNVVIRAQSNPLTLVSAVKRQVQSINRNVPVFSIHAMNELISDSVVQPRIRTVLLAIFAAVALILAAAGIYGVMSYSVTQRTHELGIRLALGAGRWDVISMVVGRGVVLALLGVAVGLASAFGLARLIANMLYQVAPTDPTSYISVSAVLLVVALLANYIPARRATKVDPVVALRCE